MTKMTTPPAGKTGIAGLLQRGAVLLCAILARLVAALHLTRPARRRLPSEAGGNAVILDVSPAVSRDYVESLVRRVHEQQKQVAYLNSIMSSMSDAVIVADLNGMITRFNKGAEKIFEVDADTVVNTDNLYRLCADSTSDSSRICDMLVSEAKIENLRIELVGFSGRKTPALLTLNYVELDGERTSIVAVIKDNSEVENLTRTDALTTLANRREFDRAVKYEHQRMMRGHSDSVSLLFLDVDHFGDFNKKYGHQVGDEVLRKMGEVLRTSVRVIDTPARYGGEEFAVILPGTDERGAILLAERIRKSLQDIRITTEKGTISVTASIGVRTHRGPKNGDERKLVDEANKAMLFAKSSGRNRSVAFERLAA